MKKIDIDKSRTIALHLQSNVNAERHNRTVCQNLSTFVEINQKDWYKTVPPFLLSYRSTLHKSTGYNPSLLEQLILMKKWTRKFLRNGLGEFWPKCRSSPYSYGQCPYHNYRFEQLSINASRKDKIHNWLHQ